MPEISHDFIFNELVLREDYCNQKLLIEKLQHSVSHGEKVLFYGKRNTGKTSLIKNIIAPYWLKSHSKGVVFFCDFLGVKTEEQLGERLANAVQDLYNSQLQKYFESLLGLLKNLRPTVELDDAGKPTLSLRLEKRKNFNIKDSFEFLEKIQKKGIPVLIVLDEFQDIAFVEGCDAILRKYLESCFSKKTPIVILGSKQHILSKLFSRNQAAFYNWGKSIEVQEIPYSEYTKYMSVRFHAFKLKIEEEESKYLQDLMHRNPECINKLCAQICQSSPKGKITRESILDSINHLIDNSRSLHEYFLSQFTISEQTLIIAIAFLGAVPQPTSKEFLSQIKVSQSGVMKIINKLLDSAVIYKEQKGYQLADPLLGFYIKRFRLKNFDIFKD